MLTTDSLIDSVKRRAGIPDAQVTFTDDDFLAFANEEMEMGIMPVVLSTHEEFLVYQEEVPLEANTSEYAIPDRAIGNKLRAVFYQDTGGNLSEMARISPDDLAIYSSDSGSNSVLTYYIKNNNVVLVPSISSNPTGSLLMFYFMRPNKLVSESRVCTVVSKTTTTVTVDSLPSIITTATPIDFLEATGGYRTLAKDVSPTAINYTTKVFTFATDDIPSQLAVGDNIALAGECIIPQIPEDLHSVLSQRVAARCHESLGDQAGLQAANAKLSEMEQKMSNIIDNRSESDPQKVTNFHGLLRGGRRRGWGWR